MQLMNTYVEEASPRLNKFFAMLCVCSSLALLSLSLSLFPFALLANKAGAGLTHNLGAVQGFCEAQCRRLCASKGELSSPGEACRVHEGPHPQARRSAHRRPGWQSN